MNDNIFHVFISWSQKPAEQIAGYVKTLFENVFAVNNNIKFFLSSSENGGIDKGEKFQKILDDNLFRSNYGILILTKNNKKQPWIMFEAGSLAKNVDIARVCPILFDIDEIEKESPLFAFQHAKFTKDEFNSLSQSILKAHNKVDELKPTEISNLTHLLNNNWDDFEKNVNNLLSDTKYRMDDLSHKLFNDGLSPENLLYLDRENHLKELIKNINDNNGNRIIVFGGISTIIRVSEKELAKWILQDEKSTLYICYENEDLINDRKEDLTDEAYDNLDKEEQLILRKKTKFGEFRDYFKRALGPDSNERIHFVELSERLSGYVTINGNELFFTPLLHKRSSLTFTFKLKEKQMFDVVDYMISKLPDGNDDLKTELEMIKTEINDK